MILAATDTGVGVNLHQGFSRVVLIYSVIVALWALFLYLRGRNPSGGLLGALVIAEAVIFVQGVIGIIVFGQGHRAHQALHYLYGLVAFLTLPTAYFSPWVQGGTQRRDSLVLGLAALFLVGLAIRAAVTGSS